MEEIPIKSVIISYFKSNPKGKIEFKELSKFRRGIENKFREKGISAYVRYSKDDLVFLAQHYSEYLNVDLESNHIENKNHKDFETLQKYFLSDIPHKIHEDYEKIFIEVYEELKKLNDKI
ncbi:MAG: hypothetical protein KC516_03105 [Nanoarchaeota archaeon]|nr:hypothetical protein [Nanoarchaeota archaeon]